MNDWKSLFILEIEKLKNSNNSKGKILLIQEVLSTIQPYTDKPEELKIFNQIQSLSKQMSVFKKDVNITNNRALEENFIPEIAEELHLIVKHTEASVDKILDIFDDISKVILKVKQTSLKDELISKSTKILEVCNFQDNVGQRINVIVNNLGDIENTLAEILESINPQIINSNEQDSPEDHLLNGPSRNAPSQMEIDDLFKNL